MDETVKNILIVAIGVLGWIAIIMLIFLATEKKKDKE